MTYEEIQFAILDCDINIQSAYNDGWTIEGYKKKKEDLLYKLSKTGRQLKIDFPE